MTIYQWLQTGKLRLKESHVECVDTDSHMRQILQHSLQLKPHEVLLRLDEEVTGSDEKKLSDVLQRRLAGEPFQYIVGYAHFWDCDFFVGPGVLIPRKETEHLVEFILEMKTEVPFRVAELGPGSGNISISVLRSRPAWRWYGFEKNSKSVPYLKENLERNLPSSKAFQLVEGNFFELATAFGPYDLVVSNPPYIATSEISRLSREVQSEPTMALDGGSQGYEIIEQILGKSKELLNPNGFVVIEIGSDQEDISKTLCKRLGFDRVVVLKDYAGLPRVLVARNKE